MTEQNPLATKSTPAVSAVFKCLYNATEPITKQEVATKCSLSLPTVYQAFSVLEERSLIDNGQNRSSTGGRRAQTFSISRNSIATIGISSPDTAFDASPAISTESESKISISSNLSIPYAHQRRLPRAFTRWLTPWMPSSNSATSA